MSCKYAIAKEGKRWVLTLAGLEDARMRYHFEQDSPMRKTYEHKVPQNWVDAGLVEEREEK